MYEIWLALNIVWEIVLAAWPVAVAALLVWVALVAAAWRRGTWRAKLPFALLFGLVAAIATFLVLPAMTRSSLGEVRYWVDWVTLAGIAASTGAIAFAFAWPLLALHRTSTRSALAAAGP